MQKNEAIQELKELYIKKMCGVAFVESNQLLYAQGDTIHTLNDKIKHCHLCARRKLSNPIIGYIKPESKVVFVVEKPFFMSDKNQELIDSRRTRKLKSFAYETLGLRDFSLLSLLKCGGEELSNQEQTHLCRPYLQEQLSGLRAKVVIVFDAYVSHAMGIESKIGYRTLWHNKHILTTYPLIDILRNPALEGEVYKHFMSIKNFLG
ncbi:uracil-DNA glycosylase family protein [Helicobacter fennelliae]|uniref:uracil-DNA glycosylase family protein n=1 Tax=Helicobacter fennelliae TaxID=215 RepID=UPI000DFE83DB|nr:uracil-DNA glycosylase family protein [Helicobacter fennelliae]STQ84859.1 uracil DNA glycosylase superfamily protein [Helicobacter fennelliae]